MHISPINISLSQYILESFDRRLQPIKDALSKTTIELQEPNLTVQNAASFRENEKFIFILDCICAFHEISKIYFEYEKNEKDWYATQIYDSLKSIKKYVDNLASLISLDGQMTDIQLNLDPSIFETGKHLSTIIKSNEEYKKFKKFVKQKMFFEKLDLQSRAIAIIIINNIRQFLQIMQ